MPNHAMLTQWVLLPLPLPLLLWWVLYESRSFCYEFCQRLKKKILNHANSGCHDSFATLCLIIAIESRSWHLSDHLCMPRLHRLISLLIQSRKSGFKKNKHAGTDNYVWCVSQSAWKRWILCFGIFCHWLSQHFSSIMTDNNLFNRGWSRSW